MDKQISELKEALEYQVDVVLRLEEERLLLLKENSLQRDKLKETNTILQKYLGQQLLQIEKACQTAESHTESAQVQTEGDDVLSDYSLSNSAVTLVQQQTCPLEEAKNLLKSSRIPMKREKLKFCGDKENTSRDKQINSASTATLRSKADSNAEALTKEIINLTKQLQQQKLANRSQQETIKKYEKDTGELVKHVEIKNEMLTKLRNENAEMALIINQDKFKSLRTLDHELKSEREAKLKLQVQLQNKQDENAQLQRDLKQFREVLGKLTDEFENFRNTQRSNSDRKESEQEVMFLREEISIRDSAIEELKYQLNQVNQEVEYFKDISCKQKEITRKQEQDLDFYRELLIKHKILQ